MKTLILALAAVTLLTLSGCGNLSPKNQPKINNEGKIGELDNMAGSLKAEIGKLQSQAEIQNSKLDRIQQGLVNFQSNNQNSGVQILSGSGGLLIAFVAILMGSVIAFVFHREAKKQEKTANVLADRIVSKNDPELTEQIFQAAMYTDVEENILKLIQKHQKRLDFGNTPNT